MSLALAQVDFGDLPTWLGVAAATLAALFVYLQLRGQQQQIARQTAAVERQQADLIDMRQFWQSEYVPDDQDAAELTGAEYWHTTKVINQSRRPIRDLAARLQHTPGSPPVPPANTARFATGPESLSGRATHTLTRAYEGPGVALARPGEAWSFLFPCIAAPTDLVSTTVRFTDDAGLHWQINQDLHLTKISRRDW